MNQIAPLSKSIETLMKSEFCKDKVTLAEFKQYYEQENPTNFGIFRIFNGNPNSFIILADMNESMNMSNYQYYVDNLVRTDDMSVMDLNFGISVYYDDKYYFENYGRDEQFYEFTGMIPFTYIDLPLTPGLEFDIEFDLLSVYRILMRRKSCLELGYAKSLVKQWFTERVDKFSSYIDVKPGFIMDLFLYLYSQMLCLNIHIPKVNLVDKNQRFLVDSERDEETGLSEVELDPDFKLLDEEIIPLMVEAIHRRIDIIDLL